VFSFPQQQIGSEEAILQTVSSGGGEMIGICVECQDLTSQFLANNTVVENIFDSV
jgi:hypothetical protein